MSDKSHVLPILVQLCDQLDQAFVETVGPFGDVVCAESRATWLAAGPHIRTRDIEAYIVLLAREVGDPDARAQFIAAARNIIGNY